MTLKFYCAQALVHHASKQTDTRYFTTHTLTYQTVKDIWNFKENHLSKGQYSFPFQLKLPQNMPSNFIVSSFTGRISPEQDTIQIRYALKVELSGVKTQKVADLTRLHYLNIIRPFKSQILPLKHQRTEIKNSCLCFKDGFTKVSIFVNKNYAITGQIIEINGQVDNMYGTLSLDALSCQLFQLNIVSNQKTLFSKQKQRGVLHTVKKFYVKKGNVQNFSFSYKIPDYLQYSTSIGKFSALVYKLRFQYKFKKGCNPENRLEFPIHIQTKTRKLEVNIDEVPSSYEWNPTIKKTVQLDILSPFEYNQQCPLQKYRKEHQQYRSVSPSFTYFNQMNAGYLTKSKPAAKKVCALDPQSGHQIDKEAEYDI